MARLAAVGRVAGQLGRRQREDQPAAAPIDRLEAERVAEDARAWSASGANTMLWTAVIIGAPV